MTPPRHRVHPRACVLLGDSSKSAWGSVLRAAKTVGRGWGAVLRHSDTHVKAAYILFAAFLRVRQSHD